MITRSDLRKTAREYLQSAQLLRTSRKYDMVVYLCGYAVEIALKERICRTLRWRGYPATSGEFSNFRSFQTHNLEVLLDLSAIEDRIIAVLGADWEIVAEWNPEQHYRPRGTYTKDDADTMSNMTSRIDTAEMISLFRKAEEEISRERGDFTLFGLFESLDIFGKYNLVVAAPWLKDDRVSANLIFDTVRASIGNDQWFTKVRVGRIVPENGPFAAAVREALPNGPIEHSMKRLTNFFYDGEIIRDAVIITSVEAAAEAEMPKRKARAGEPVAA